MGAGGKPSRRTGATLLNACEDVGAPGAPMHHVKWDCFVWPTDLDCGKSLAPLAFVTRLRKDTRRTLRIQHEGAAGRSSRVALQRLPNYYPPPVPHFGS